MESRSLTNPPKIRGTPPRSPLRTQPSEDSWNSHGESLADTTDAIWAALENVMDPEIPVLSVIDLGMITGMEINDAVVLVKMIPTFAACPAITVIKKDIKTELEKRLGITVIVEIDKTVQWNSNRLTDAAKEKLKNFKIAPPEKFEGEVGVEMLANIECPHCHSHNTYLRSPFGSTLCRAIHYCKDCGMVFEQFKPVE